MEELFSQSSDELIDNNANPPEGLPDGVYTYGDVNAIYKKENGRWFKKIGNLDYAPLTSGNVEERVKLLEEKAVQVPEDKRLIERYTNIQDIDVNQPVKQYKDVFEAKENTLIKEEKPVKESPKYNIVDNNGIQTWQVKKKRDVQERIDPKTGEPMGLSYVDVYEDITDPKKVAELNKKNGVQASTSKEQQYFTGYPGQEGSEYRINDDNLWEVKRPGSNEFLTIVSPKSVSSLNSHFKQNAEVFDDKKAEEIKIKNDYINDFNIRLNKVNQKLIGGSEENAVETLSKLFPEFRFEQTGLMTDNIKVSKIKNGVVVASDEISLDNFFDDADNLNAQRLKDWLRTNVISDLNNSYKAYNEAVAGVERKISETIYGQDPEISKVVSDATSVNNTTLNEQIRRSVSSLSSTFFPEETKKVEEAGAQLTKDYARVVRDTYARVKDKSKEEQATAFMAIKTDDIIINAANNYSNDVKDNYNTFISQQKNFKSYVDDIDAKVKSGEISQEEYENNYKQKIKDGAADIEIKAEKLKEDLTSLDYYVRGSEKAIASNLIIKEMTGTTAGAFGRSIVDGAMSIPTFIAGMNKEERKKFTDSIVGVGTTDEYMQSDNRYDLTKAAFQMTRSLSAMAVGRIGAAALGLPAVAGGYVSLFAMGYNEMKDSLDGVGDISSEDKVIMSSLYALGSAALENYGLGFLLTKSVAKKAATNWILKNAFSQIAKNATKEMVEAQIMNSAKLYASKIALETGGGMIVEGVVEGSQAGAQKLVQEAYDQIKGTEYFNNESAYEIVGDILHESYYGALGAMSVTSVLQSKEVLSRGVNSLKNNDQIKLLISSANVEGMDEALLTNLKASILSGKISKTEAKEIVESFQNIKGKINSMPDDMSIDNKSVALDLMIERDNLNKKIEGKDPFLVVKEKERIGQINEQLKNLGNAVQEPSTEGVLQREQEGVTEAGGERGGMEPIVKGEEVTKEGEATAKEEVTVDKEAIQKNSSTEVERVKSLTNDVEDGATFNLDGTKYEGKGLVVPVVSKNTTAEEISPEMISDFVEEHKDKIGDNETVKVGIYKFPNSNKVSIDLNILAPESSREQAIEFGKNADQESLFDLGTFENVKTGGTGGNPVQFTNNQFKEISRAFAEGRVPNVFGKETTIPEVTITPETSQTVTDRISKEPDVKRKKVFTAVQKVLSAIPNSRIILHDNTDAFVSGVAKSAGITNYEAISQGVNNNRGSYVNGDIHINLETAGVTTVFHEAFHDLLAKKGMDNNALLDMAKGLKSVISDRALKQRLDEFVSNYEEGDRAEEYSTELGAIMAEAQKELSTTKFQQFKTLVNKIAKKLGLPVVFSAASTAQDAVDFMNSMAGKLGKGENILTDGFQTNIVSDKIKSQKPVKVNKDQKLTFVKQSDIIDIKSLINEIASKNQNVLFWVGDQLGRGLYFDNVINGEHYLDAGPSYALDPENRSKGIIWASGANPTTISNNIERSDYIFIVSGSPQSSKLFNKSVSNLVKSRIESKVDFNEFKNNILNSKPTKPIRDIINKYNSYDELFNGSDRKSFIIAINEQQSKDTQLKKLLESYDAFVDPNELRDGFYKENDFKMGDVMLVLKPEKIGDKSKHSTYETDIIGSVVGVPDMVINSYDLMPEEIKNKYKENLERAQQQQVVAPYGMGVKQISKIKAQKNIVLESKGLSNNSIKTIEENYQNSFGFFDFNWNKESERNNFKEWLNNFESSQFDKNLSKVINLVKQDIDLLTERKIIQEKLKSFEELIIPSIGNDVLTISLSKFEEDILMNPNATIESIEKGFKEAKNIFDKEGNIDKTKITPSNIFKGEEINLPAFEKFIEKNPEYKNVFDDWKKIFDRDIELTSKETNAFSYNINIEKLENLYNELNNIQSKIKIKAQKQSREDAIQDAKDKYDISVEKRGKDHNTGVTAAIADLQKSDWYRDADDMQREEAVREIRKFFGEKLKAAPSIAKVTGKTKQTAFVSDLAAAIRDQVKLQARSSRETAKNINDRRKALGVAIKQVVSQYKGKITERQLNAINRKIANVNLFNQEMVERVIDYVDKVMNNAEYATKVNNAFAERRAIRRMMKSGNMAETVAVAKEFTQIDPSMVDDIDTYLEMAQKIRGAVKSSKRIKDSVSLKQIVNFGEAYEYIKPILDAQEESMKNMLLAEYNDLAEAGVISKDMTLKDINKILNKIRLDEKVDSKEEQSIRKFLNQRFESVKSIISMVAKGYNPLTGEIIEISDRNKQMIAKVVKSDINNMSTKQLIEMVDSLYNFVENGAVGGIENAYSTYVGEQNAASLKDKGVVARKLKLYFNPKLGEIHGKEVTPLVDLFNRMFVGVKRGIDVMTDVGFADVILGANKARRQVKDIQDKYVQRFGKIKNFFQVENAYERGAIAFLKRNLIGSEIEVKSEFNRRVDWLFESAERLKKGTQREKKMAEVYEKVLDKLDVKSRDLNTIIGKADPNNVAAVDWWINEWSTHYSDLSDVSRSVYNTILGKDINYTPDRLRTTSEGSSQSINDKILESKSAFLMNTDAITDINESGVIIASVRPKIEDTEGRYVSLDFDVNNIESLTGALVDINTAGAIRQVASFFKSNSFESIVPSVEDRTMLNERVNKYIRRIKNKLSVPNDVFRDIDNALNTVSSVGTSLGLGGVLQSVKQTVSVAISTAIQTGTSFNIYAGQDFNDWLNTTGASVSNRGQESLTAIESANKKIQSFNGTFDKAIDTYKNLTQWQLRLFLSRPDVFVARSAFKSYYEQFLKSNGYDVSKINWSTWNETIKKEGIEELNKKAVVYADTMVSRQQNVSDERLAGELLSSEDSARKLIRKALLPFASFSINQRARLFADINALFLNWNNISSEDKAIAIKSIAGTTAEQGVFQMINFGIGMALYSVAQSMSGHDDDDEEWNKRMRNATKYPLKSLLADMTSPNPLADDAVVFGADQLLAMFGSPSESEITQAIKDEEALRELLGKDPMTESQINKFKEQYKKDNTYQLAYNFSNAEEGKYGMFSIVYDQYVKLAENSEMANNGTFTDEYMGKETTKYLTDKDKSIAKSVFYGLEIPYTTGAGVKEMGQVANKTYSIIKKRGLTENQYETYKQFKKDFKKEPQEWEINLIKSTDSANDALAEFDFIKEQGGISPKQGLEYLKVFKKIGPLNPEDYRMIIDGKKADQIIKSALK